MTDLIVRLIFLVVELGREAACGGDLVLIDWGIDCRLTYYKNRSFVTSVGPQSEVN